ncbi:MAG: hypothetical protein FWD85_08220 [Microbacteriaceae bacterium]|nr:hypothetical protein [Microbacteriaceae bacterium]MCL2795276.1 hypothetical protein [Microbacteriaceae bacterium]
MRQWVLITGLFSGWLFYLVVIAFVMWALYGVIKIAVRTALDEHHRKLQWFEETGLWYSGRPPKGLPGATQLSRSERRHLPKSERPQKGS